MPRTCTVCSHKNVGEIDEQLLGGTSLRNISKRFKICHSNLYRHKESGHIATKLLKAHDIKEQIQADKLLDQVKALRERANTLLDLTESQNDYRAAGLFLKELRELVRLWAELENRISTQPQINLTMSIYNSPEWYQVGNLLAKILAPHPELRTLVAKGLLDLAKSEIEITNNEISR